MGNSTTAQNSLAQWWRERERKWPWVVAALLLLLFVIAGVFGGEDRDSGSPEEDQRVATLPDGLTGMDSASARDQLEEQGFLVTVESVDGRMVIAESNWNVVSASLRDARNVLLRVGKPTQMTTTPSDLADTPTAIEAPTVDVTPEPAPDPATVEEPVPAPAPDAYYANCAEARAAGAAPMAAGEPGYRSGLDRDNEPFPTC